MMNRFDRDSVILYVYSVISNNSDAYRNFPFKQTNLCMDEEKYSGKIKLEYFTSKILEIIKLQPPDKLSLMPYELKYLSDNLAPKPITCDFFKAN